ncbi:hypothetical protein [Streptomyces flaveus]|uniref:hypothetical protein n=1 Tax=Streptomyces flaveus TaxID=66370 RepID=UPI00332180B0
MPCFAADDVHRITEQGNPTKNTADSRFHGESPNAARRQIRLCRNQPVFLLSLAFGMVVMDSDVFTADMHERVQAARRRHDEAAAARYSEGLPQREAAKRPTGQGVSLPDTETQLQARAEHLISGDALPMETVMSLAAQEKPGRRLLERIIGASKDLQAVNFLSRGSRAAATAGRVPPRPWAASRCSTTAGCCRWERRFSPPRIC